MAKKKEEKSPEVALPSPKSTGEDYEAKEALQTIMRAEEIKGNKELMKRVSKLAHKQKKAINSIADLKEVANSRREEITDEES